MAEPPRRPIGLGIWPAELKLIENPVYPYLSLGINKNTYRHVRMQESGLTQQICKPLLLLVLKEELDFNQKIKRL